jgi:hypothetical protein
MAMLVRKVARASQPHLSTLADSLRPLLAVATPASSFHLRYESGAVVIEQNSFTGCDPQAIDAAVASAPEHTEVLDVKAQLNALPLLMKAIVLALIDGINIERARHGVAAITPAQAIASIVAKVDALG